MPIPPVFALVGLLDGTSPVELFPEDLKQPFYAEGDDTGVTWAEGDDTGQTFGEE